MGWVLVEGQDADGATLDRDEFTVRKSDGLRAVENAEQATAAVMQTQAKVDAQAQRLHAVGVTWSDDATADAALLLESLTDAGFDNVVPVRFPRAAEAPTRGVAPEIGSHKTAACLLEKDSVTVIMPGDGAGDAQAEATRTSDDDGLVRWIAETFDQNDWRPDGLVLAGARTGLDLDEVAQRLESALGLKVLVRSGAQVALARGAALASAPSAEFIDALPVETPVEHVEAAATRRSPKALAYAGGVTALAAGAVTLVTSLSLAVGLHLVDDRGDRAGTESATSSVTRDVAEKAVSPSRAPRVEPVREPMANPPEPPPEAPAPDAPPAAEEPAPDVPVVDGPMPGDAESEAPEELAADEPAPEEMVSDETPDDGYDEAPEHPGDAPPPPAP